MLDLKSPNPCPTATSRKLKNSDEKLFRFYPLSDFLIKSYHKWVKKKYGHGIMWGIERGCHAKIHTVITVRISVDQNLTSLVVIKKKKKRSELYIEF